MPVDFQQYVARAAESLDKPGGVPPFTDVFDTIVPTLDMSDPATTWRWTFASVALSLGETALFPFFRVPDNEVHEYHYISLQGGDIGPKLMTATTEPRNPQALFAPTWLRVRLDLRMHLNMLGDLLLDDDETGATRGPLTVLPGFQLSIGLGTGIVAAGPILVGMYAIKKILRPPFEVEQVEDQEATVIIP